MVTPANTTFLGEIATVFFGELWWIFLAFFIILILNVLEWFGVIRTAVARWLPGSTAAVCIDMLAIFALGIGIALYRTIWGQPATPVFAYMLPLIGSFALIILVSSLWLLWTQRPPAFLVPRWVREVKAQDRAAAQSAASDSSARHEDRAPDWARTKKVDE